MPGVNDCIPYYESADRITARASAGLSGKRLLSVSGSRTSGPAIPASPAAGASDPVEGGTYQVAQSAALGAVVGVSAWDAASGEHVGVIIKGIVPVTAEAAIAAGARVESGANGKVRTLTTGAPVGVCMTAASGADVDAEILLNLG